MAEAVIETFQTVDMESHSDHLATFSYSAWVGIYDWLDASGLALYFLERLQSLGAEDVIPPRVLGRLKQNYADNRKKTDRLFQEFIQINNEFRKENISYVNIKGFTLIPDACTDLALRYQLDLDFFVAFEDSPLCDRVLERLGYFLTGSGESVKEFKTAGENVPSIKSLYKEKGQQCVEIHFDRAGGNAKVAQKNDLSRPSAQVFEGIAVPTLSDCDRFLLQARHLFKHLKSEWTRASWMLEFAHFINFHRKNETLWREVEAQMAVDVEIKLAVGTATLASKRSFSIAELPQVLSLAVLSLPSQVSIWVELYSRKIIYARFPGTKLYLLLRCALAADETESSIHQFRRLLPLHRPARVTIANKPVNIFARLNLVNDELEYFFVRLRFHLEQSFNYLMEAIRWKRRIASVQDLQL
ncbi:nucleotidyltransferase family protein [Granulicella sp. S190]|uniref:nucleotidyltransferase family protein n=1 Tax=Granulicella sp. S190 TaxID=1747226 RepID=UPI00131C812B|nr:nucleotidyltransferase family protein [Granulicella sp. S190]